MKRLSRPIVTGLIGTAAIVGVYFLGYAVGHQNIIFEKNFIPTVTNKEIGRPKDIDFSLFWDVWDQVKDKYAGEINNQEMVYDAINGALRSLDDPYTLFLPPDEAKRFNDDLRGSFDGIGAEIEKRSGNLTIVAPLEGSPAQKAGLRAKDIIIEIDGAETTDMQLDEAIDKIRGKKGSVVKLTVIREGAGQPIEVSVTRDTIVVKSVTSEIRSDNIGYIKMSQFGEDTEDLLNKAVDEMIAKKPKGLIIDVRNNPGGFLDTAVDAGGLFLKDRAVIVKEKNKAGDVQELRPKTSPKLTDMPIVILVNGGSASASEIFAGALQDYGRAKLVGEQTYGKGSVQQLESVAGGGAVRITVAQWLTPKDRAINKVGIKPDIEIKLTEDDVKANRDPQLDRAIKEFNK